MVMFNSYVSHYQRVYIAWYSPDSYSCISTDKWTYSDPAPMSYHLLVCRYHRPRCPVVYIHYITLQYITLHSIIYIAIQYITLHTVPTYICSRHLFAYYIHAFAPVALLWKPFIHIKSSLWYIDVYTLCNAQIQSRCQLQNQRWRHVNTHQDISKHIKTLVVKTASNFRLPYVLKWPDV